MKKLLIILSLAAIVFTTTSQQGFCFPDMSKYPHYDGVTEDGLKFKMSTVENLITLRKMKSDDFSGLYGCCPATKYEIYITDEISDIKKNLCIIFPSNSDDGELSSRYMEMESDGGILTVSYFFKDKGRIMTFTDKGKKGAFWQSWV